MKNLTMPKVVLIGFFLIAFSIASIPYSEKIIKPAFALGNNALFGRIQQDHDYLIKKITEEIRNNCK